MSCPYCGAVGGHYNLRGVFECGGCSRPIIAPRTEVVSCPDPDRYGAMLQLGEVTVHDGGRLAEQAFDRMMRSWLS